MWDLNLRLFRAINGWPDSWAPFWRFFSEAANHIWFKIAVVILVVAMISRAGRARPTVIQALIAFPLANGFTDLFKNYLPEHRPYQDLLSVIPRPHDNMTLSFGTASAHAANMAAIAFVFTYCLGWWGAPWIAAALLVGTSRVYVGAHYPYQVLLGWTCGIVAGLLVTQLWNRIAASRAATGPGPSDSEQSSPRTEQPNDRTTGEATRLEASSTTDQQNEKGGQSAARS